MHPSKPVVVAPEKSQRLLPFHSFSTISVECLLECLSHLPSTLQSIMVLFMCLDREVIQMGRLESVKGLSLGVCACLHAWVCVCGGWDLRTEHAQAHAVWPCGAWHCGTMAEVTQPACKTCALVCRHVGSGHAVMPKSRRTCHAMRVSVKLSVPMRIRACVRGKGRVYRQCACTVSMDHKEVG